MIRSAYLRVYVPAERSAPVTRHVPVRWGAVIRASDHFVWSEPLADDAFVVEWDGKSFACPRSPRLRMLEGLLAFNQVYPGAMLLPERAIRDATDQLDELRSARPEARSYILTSPWHVPLRWFGAFRPEQRELYESSGGKSIRYRAYVRDALARVEWAVRVLDEAGFDSSIVDQVGDLERWLRDFAGDAMLELDYAATARWFSDAELALDDSAEEVERSLRALEAGDFEEAGLAYAMVASRWAPAQALTYTN